MSESLLTCADSHCHLFSILITFDATRLPSDQSAGRMFTVADVVLLRKRLITILPVVVGFSSKPAAVSVLPLDPDLYFHLATSPVFVRRFFRADCSPTC